MIKSMTGFGRGSAEVDGRTVTIELRSVNNRYLEVHSRLPREYAELEAAAKARIKESVRRGRVDVVLTLESAESDLFNINVTLVGNYLRIFRQLQGQFGIGGEITLASVLQMPGVIDLEGSSTAPSLEALKPAFDAAFDRALEALREFRAIEGRSLAVEMKTRLKILSDLLERIQPCSENLLAYYQQRLAGRIRELLPEGMADADRIIMEAAIYAEKSDIREEIVRLRSHIDQFQGLLDSDSEVGKRLDFLLQEMNRETNTILSKAGPVEIAQMGVEMKAEIEKLREQVQNIE